MKDMIYKLTLEYRDVLYSGEYLGYNFYILSLGMYPVAYVEVPIEHKYCNKHYDDINIEVHGGLTYSSDCLLVKINPDEYAPGYWFIGWDYAHAGDYVGFQERYPETQRNDKKWTTEEIFEDVKSVIKQLKEAENE